MRKGPSAYPSLVSHGRVASCVRGCKVPAPTSAHPVSHSPPSGSLPTGLVGRPFTFPSVAPASQPAPALTPALAPALVAPSCAGLSSVVTNRPGESRLSCRRFTVAANTPGPTRCPQFRTATGLLRLSSQDDLPRRTHRAHPGQRGGAHPRWRGRPARRPSAHAKPDACGRRSPAPRPPVQALFPPV